MLTPTRLLAALFWLTLAPAAAGVATPGTARQTSVEPAKELLISAAASLKTVLTAIAPAFEKAHPEIKLVFNFGGSGQLRIQIEHGAPVDVFLPASGEDLNLLDSKGLVLAGSQRILAGNSLVLIRPESHSRFATLPIRHFQDLLNPKTLRIAMANPATVPAGRYAQEALEMLHLYPRIQSKLVFTENVRHALDYVARGEVEAGLVYRTDARAEPRVRIVETISDSLHRPIHYPAGVLLHSAHPGLAKRFIDFLVSRDSKRTFQEMGFLAAP